MERATPHYLTVNSSQIHLWRSGEGPDLVVLGGLTLGAEVLANRLAAANPGWRVTAVELPGVGGSMAVVDGDLRAMTAILVEALRAAGLIRFVLVGHEFAAALLPPMVSAMGSEVICFSVGRQRAVLRARTARKALDIEPRQDGSHLNVLWHHLRDHELLAVDNPFLPAKSGDLISSPEELSQSFVAAATNPSAYAAAWSLCLEHIDMPTHVSDVETLADLSAELVGFALPASSKPLPSATALPAGALWHDYVRTSRGLMHLRRSGDSGAPLLVIPTGGGSSAQFAPVVLGLAKSRQTFSVDYFGNGLSDKPDRNVTIEMLAADMAALIEALGFERVDVWGSHTGALVGLELAVGRPDLVRKAVFEGPVFIDPGFQADLLDNYFPRFEPDKWGLHLQRIWHWRRDMFMYWPWYRVDRAAARDLGVPSAQDLHLYAVGILESGSTYDQAYRSAFRYDTAVRLPLLKRPALISAGPNDMLVNGVAEAEKLGVPCVRTMLTPTTVWWPAPDRRAAVATMAIYDEYLRDTLGL